jgi:hypothetical protein
MTLVKSLKLEGICFLITYGDGHGHGHGHGHGTKERRVKGTKTAM